MRRITLSLMLLFTATVLFAIPARRGQWRTITLADGTEVRAQLCGDEHLRYMQTADGQCYVWNGSAYDVADMPALQAKAQLRRAKADNVRRARAPRRVGGAGKVYSGKKKGLVILVQFPAGNNSWGSLGTKAVSFQAGHDKALYERMLNEPGFTHADGVNGSVKDYFKEQSGGTFELDFDVYGPVTLAHDYSYYGTDNGGDGNDAYPEEMVIEAVNAVQQGVDFSPYDWDGNGEVDQVYVLYAGLGQANGGSANTIWPHEWQLSKSGYSLTVNNGNVKIDTYACGPELQPERDEDDSPTGRYLLDGIGTFCHEFSHCLGLPDMYDTSYKADGMYCWDLMDYGSYLNNGYTPCGYTSYEKMFVGWLTPKELTTTDQTVTALRPLSEGGDAYIIYNDAHKDEFYMLENRQRVGFDSALPGTGLLVLHVDYDKTIWETNKVNSVSTRQRCTVVPADGSTEYLTQVTRDGQTYDAYDYVKMSGDPYPYQDNDSLTNNSFPAATLYNTNTDGKRMMNKGIHAITQNADGTVSFNYKAVSTTTGGSGGNWQYAAGTVLFHETFDNCNGTGGNKAARNGDIWSGTVATASFRPDNDDADNNWQTYENYANGKPMAWGGYKCARFGSGSMPGDFQTPYFTLRGEAMLTFRAAPWGNDGATVEVFCAQGEPESRQALEACSVGSFTRTNGQWSDVSVVVTGKGDEMFLLFEPEARLFVDDIKVYIPEPTGIILDEGLRMKDESNNPSSFISHPSSVYDLQGRKVEMLNVGKLNKQMGQNRSTFQPFNLSTLKPGIYIVGGRKIFIK